MRHVFVDIETLPPQSMTVEDVVTDIEAPSNYRDPDKIAAYKAEKAVDHYRKMALDSMRGEVLCVGAAVDDGPVVVLNGVCEAIDYLYAQGIRAPGAGGGGVTWVAHNATYDLTWMWRHALRARHPHAHMVPHRRWDRAVGDTMAIWQGIDYRSSYVSLDDLAAWLGVTRPATDITGATVLDAYLAGRLDEIRDYCRADVETVREVYWRIVHPTRGAPVPDDLE